MSETVDKIFIHCLEFDKFLPFVEYCSFANSLTVYSMPNKAESYADSDKITDLIKTLNEYNGSEQWRMTINENVQFAVDKEKQELRVGKYVIKDALEIVLIAPLNMVFIIPGPNTTDFKPCEIIQLNNLVKYQPMVFAFEDIEENDKHKLAGKFVPITDL